ncbi:MULTISPECIES: MarR family winged helix-turn-helix transcriptional regulator [Luteococcus]|uniref:Transcriptional regulator, MarR family n=1 Tax=Luteococcus japonicus LSP_Lj1 TaxID=1255658 RepID=A0A1R4IEQ0_9ACTN|nr:MULTISPECIES: MarR family winged helix-turn-helix transcriptional regulator [Luteococcus]MDN5563603.1 MarR family winged helix-turn-helix transcriptional regulator [Luteococcus sp.]SJN18340.1 Transcriptional regulator, MarR family [Luteococcus japonicus LSP_Lj1]
MTETPQTMVARAWQENCPGLDVSPIEIFGRLRHLQEQHEEALAPLYEGAPISQGETAVLIFLRHAEGPTIARRLAHQRGCSAAAMGKLLSKLERRGMVTRRPNPADRRSALVEITPTGARMVDDYFPRQLALEASILDGLPQEWRQQFVEAMDVLSDRLRPLAGP